MINEINKRDEADSPCIGVCKLNTKGVCEGCKRTSKQIKEWWGYTDKEKIKINKGLKINKDLEQDYYG